jgi:hypothetical protein
MTTAVTAACAALLGSLIVAAPAYADGLSSCKEDPDTLQAEARKTIEIISEKVPLGPYETAGTVLQFGHHGVLRHWQNQREHQRSDWTRTFLKPTSKGNV